jgi:alkylated DNA repair dioxygenase AlkB
LIEWLKNVKLKILQMSQLIKLNLQDVDVRFLSDLLSEEDANFYLNDLIRTVDWKQEELKFKDKIVPFPRLTAWFGDEGLVYNYSGVRNVSDGWHPTILKIKEKIESYGKSKFNSVLVNYYRDGKDSISWHSDSERDLRQPVIIASVSLGAERIFKMKHKTTKQLHKIAVRNGSLLIMGRGTQEFYQHCIDKEPSILQPRINLTFRQVA